MHGYVSSLVTKTSITIRQSWWHSLATVHPTTTLPDLSCAGVNKLEAGVGLRWALLVGAQVLILQALHGVRGGGGADVAEDVSHREGVERGEKHKT